VYGLREHYYGFEWCMTLLQTDVENPSRMATNVPEMIAPEFK